MADGAARWEHFHHEADIGVRGRGPTVEASFEQAALGLTAVVADPEKVEAREAVDLACEAPARDLLLVDWLNAIVYEMGTRGMLFGRFEVHLDGARLSARAWGERVDSARHEPAVEIKGATYTELRVGEDPDAGGFVAQCVVDV